MKKRIIYLLISILGVSQLAQAQDLSVHGTVFDENGGPLPGASIVVKGTTIGAQSDFDGNYSIEAPSNATLIFSYIGYQTIELPVNGQTSINVDLQISASELDEVVLIGYGSQKKSDLTGAITSLASDELNKGGAISNVGQAIQGKAAGVVVTQNSKAPGGSTSIRIRGSNSISSTNEPLYVVDGFPTESGIDMNPDDIASMEILKDASATAIYGSRGANGVVLITTKRAKAGQSDVSFNTYLATQKVVNPFNMLDGQDYMQLANALYKEIPGQENQENGVYTQSQLNSTVNTDWIDATTRNGLIQSYNFQFRGGSEKTKVLSSLGYFDQAGILKNTNFSRVSGRVNVDQEISDRVKTGVSVMAQRESSNYQIYDGNILNSNVLYSILTYDPTVPIYNADGSFGRPPGGRGDNPLANLIARENEVQKDKFNGSMYLELTIMEGLKARFNAGTEIRHDQLGAYLSKDSYQGSIDGGVANVSDHSLTHNLVEAFVTYDKTWNVKHVFQLMGGYSYEKYINESKGVNVYGFSTDLYGFNNLGAASTISGVSSSKSENLLASFFGRVNYTFDNKYLFTVTVRADGSSRFGEDNKWGVFPSGSFAWKLINEPFMENQNAFSDLKLRAGYGKTGNERIGNYASYGLISNTQYTYDGNTNTSGTILNSSSPENSKLKWETTSQYNVGIDAGILDNRVTFNIDGYYKKTNDLLIRINLPMYSGYTQGLNNIGAIENTGLEFGIESKNFVGDFTWNTRLNLAMNRNEVLNLGDQTEILLTSSKPIGNVSEENYATIRVGEPLGSLYGYKYIGVLQAGETYSPQPNSVPGDPKFEDLNGDGIITSDDRDIIGSAYPKLNFGFTNNFTYKNFDLSVFFYGNVGNDLLNMTRMNMEWNRTVASLNRWTPQNTDTDLPRNGFFYSQYGGYINSHFIEDASFLRLQNLTLGYTLPLKTDIFNSFRVYLMAENLFTITNYSGWDPEVNTKAYENDQLVKYGGNSQTANAGAGMDFNSYPTMRAFTFGLNVTF
ncbi:TonB-dependent receptor [Flavobacteriaceae bacterium F89]|uniref:TonB-dependent receptor n=1 Tax=Cerina litoralis TaxID=2874477 RepID=A0AAE3EXG4_9FLAO|nr:TonB-dependent receptor [Cerina litoralis]MCG2462280.1 TonB-dependent receptor [Cerina litoralis]